ncbi:MAG: signal peptidase I [Clostridia bacterium]|nr:signal peptidase I [Clostridia bacterium]
MLAIMIDDKEIKLPEDKEFLSFFEKRILQERKKKSRHRLYIDLVITAVVVFIIFSVVAGMAIVQGDSMKPNLTNHSVALFYRLDKTYDVNDIVIFNLPDEKEILIKRVVAVAGDTVDIDDKTGELKVNGVVKAEDYIYGETHSREGGTEYPLKIPEGYVFVLGDNREVAKDSRDFGAVECGELLGKVSFEIKIVNG